MKEAQEGPGESRPPSDEGDATQGSENLGLTRDELLARKGFFYLKDIAGVLELDPARVLKRARTIRKQGQSPWRVMGVRNIWRQWVVAMRLFAPYYRKHRYLKVRCISPDWDRDTLLGQQGLFFLTEISRRFDRLFPFSTRRLRERAKSDPKARREFGIWKDKELNAYVVDMARFGPYVRGLWHDGSESSEDRN